jgi:hypothetical protein
MLRRRLLATAAGTMLAASARVFAQTRTTIGVKTGYAPVNGLNLYYEIVGTGEPLILLVGWARPKCSVSPAFAFGHPAGDRC